MLLNLFQHLIKAFLPMADTSFIPVPAYRGRHRAGFLAAFQIKSRGDGCLCFVDENHGVESLLRSRCDQIPLLASGSLGDLLLLPTSF